MKPSAVPALIKENLFRFGPGDKFVLPIGLLTSDALVLSQLAQTCREKGERLLVICADPLDAVRLTQELPWFNPNLGVRCLPDW